MGKLTTAARNNLSLSQFALAGRRYPVNDKPHAAAAKSRASAAVNAGRMSKSTEATVDAAANKTLYGSRGAPPPKGGRR